MSKRNFGLLAMAIGIAYASPASAHFSQVFGPFRAQLVLESQEKARFTCEGRYASAFSTDWIDAHGD